MKAVTVLLFLLCSCSSFENERGNFFNFRKIASNNSIECGQLALTFFSDKMSPSRRFDYHPGDKVTLIKTNGENIDGQLLGLIVLDKQVIGIGIKNLDKELEIVQLANLSKAMANDIEIDLNKMFRIPILKEVQSRSNCAACSTVNAMKTADVNSITPGGPLKPTDYDFLELQFTNDLYKNLPVEHPELQVANRAKVLKSMHYEVEPTTNSSEAIKALKNGHPVIVDYQAKYGKEQTWRVSGQALSGTPSVPMKHASDSMVGAHSVVALGFIKNGAFSDDQIIVLDSNFPFPMLWNVKDFRHAYWIRYTIISGDNFNRGP